MVQQPKHKRRIKIIKPRLQLKLVSIFVGMAALAILLQSILVAHHLTGLANELPESGQYIVDALPGLFIQILVFTVGLVLPLIFAVGVLVTHRIAGPVYRFEQHLLRMAAGEEVEPCRLRQGDELQGLCEIINRVIERVQGASDEAPDAESVQGLRRAG